MSAPRDASLAAWRDAAEALAAADGEVGFVRALRAEARERFVAHGLPHRRLEAWRHTSLAALDERAWAAPATDAGDRAGPESGEKTLAPDAGASAALIDGRLVIERTDEDAVRLGSIASARTGGEGESVLAEVLGQLADPKRDGFAALNTALLDDGALIEVSRRARPAGPIRLSLIDTAPERLACPRLALVARPGSEATLVVEHRSRGTGARLGAFVAELLLEDDARLDVVVLQDEGAESLSFSDWSARVGRDARLAVHTVTVGGRLVRNDLSAVLAGTGGEVDMRGLFVGHDRRLVDNHTVADHAVPHTRSAELYKGVLGGESHGVFCGRVIVRPDAQKIDSRQSNPNLLLGERAEIDTQPQLEIYADDVQCSHGSTVGRLDPAALFYLRARGIGEAAARAMLTRGFAHEIVDAVPGEALRARVAERVAQALDEATADADGASR